MREACRAIGLRPRGFKPRLPWPLASSTRLYSSSANRFRPPPDEIGHVVFGDLMEFSMVGSVSHCGPDFDLFPAQGGVDVLRSELVVKRGEVVSGLDLDIVASSERAEAVLQDRTGEGCSGNPRSPSWSK